MAAGAFSIATDLNFVAGVTGSMTIRETGNISKLQTFVFATVNCQAEKGKLERKQYFIH